MKSKIGCVLACLFALVSYAQQVETYAWPTEPGEALLSTHYKITLKYADKEINSQVIMSESKDLEIPNFAQEMRSRTFNWTSFSSDFSQPVTIEVEKISGEGAQDIEIVPSPFHIQHTLSVDGKKVSFVLTEPRYVSVNFKSTDNLHTSDGVVKHMLMIFSDPLETDIPSKTGSGVHVYGAASTAAEINAATTIYFPAGWHDLTKKYNDVGNMAPSINKDGMKIYFEGGAYVHGRIYGANQKNIKIYGRGVLSGRNFKWAARLSENGGILGVDSYNQGEAHIGLSGTDNTIEGIIVCDGAGHGINMGGSRSTYSRVKYWGWHPNNDGMRPWGEGNKIDNCFVRPCDDALYNKGLTVTNNVFWPGFNGALITLGWDGNYHTENSTLTDNYVIYPEWRGMGNNNGIVMSQIDYDMKGINVEIENMYIDGNIPALLNLHNNSGKLDANDFKLPTDFTAVVGFVRNIQLKNVFVFGKQVIFDGNAFDQTPRPNKSLIKGTVLSNGDIYKMSNIILNNVVIDGECITSENQADFIDIDAATTENIQAFGCLENNICNNQIVSPLFSENDGLWINNNEVSATVGSDINLRLSGDDLAFTILWTLPDNTTIETDGNGLLIEETQKTASGSYIAAYSTPDGCSGTVTFEVTIKDPLSTNMATRILAIYPNPARDIINLPQFVINTKFQIFDNAGKIVYQGSETKVDVSQFKSGIYFIKSEYHLGKFFKE